MPYLEEMMSIILNSDSGRLALRPRARLMRTFGNELISNEFVAIIELVKNSYDADATCVIIRFTGTLIPGQGQVEVIDNGHGMKIETILATWMEPATSFKRTETRSPTFGRRMTGEKGIGRFASSKLADTLEVISRRTNSAEEARVMFDWRQYDDDAKYLDEIESLWEVAAPSEIVPEGIFTTASVELDDANVDAWTSGTILRMERLKDTWTREKFRKLRTALSRLVPPKLKSKQAPKFDDFQIIVALPDEFADLSGSVGPSDILERSPYDVTGEIDEIGNYHLVGQLQGNLFEASGRFKLKDDRLPTCGPLHLELRIWDRDATGLAELARSFNSTQKNIREELDNVAGFHIYRDGFRVLPYGERDNDWLRLDSRRVNNPTLRLSNNQILGFVLISADRNPYLRDQSNREGLMESTATEDLRELLILCLSEVEPRRWALRHPPKAKGEKTNKQSLFQGFSLSTLGDAIKKRHSEDQELQELFSDKEAEIKVNVDEVQQVLARYHRLATLGTLVDTMLHDGRAPLTMVKNEAGLAKKTLGKAKLSPTDKLRAVEDAIDVIASQSESLATVFRRLEPFAGRKRGRPAKVLLENIIRDAFAVVATETLQVAAKVSLPTSSTEVTVDSAELQEVLINLILNSLYWLREVPKDQREITVTISRPKESSVEILFSDSGPGVSPEIRDLIFEPYISKKPDGVGLGLAISGEIVKEYYDGDLELCASGPLSGATFRITLNKRV